MKDAPQSGFIVQVLLTEQQIAGEFAAALAGGFLDEKFFYWLPNSAQAWVELCSYTEYRNANRSLKLIESNARDLARLWPKAEALCGIGCGEGTKDVPLLTTYSAEGNRLAYRAADFSQPLLELACVKALAAGASPVTGIKLDIFDDAQLATLGRPSSPAQQIFSILGNTLGAFGPTTFPARLRKIMDVHDRALFDGEIFAGEETLRGYDNPINRKFAFSPLAGLGLQEGRDGNLVFELKPGDDGTHQVAKYFVPSRDLAFNVAGHKVRLASGKKLLMSGSVKYEEGAIQRLLRQGGFEIEYEARSPDGKFLLAGVAPG